MCMKYLFAMLLLAVFSCNKDKSYSCSAEEGSRSEAKIVWSGPPEADGCGWLVLINTVYYHPEFLPPAFQQTDLEVEICYEPSQTDFRCGFGAAAIPAIHIRDIKKL